MKIDLADPTEVLVAASRALDAAGLQVAAYGGLALAMYGEPRETKDADLAVAGVSASQAHAALQAAGFDVVRAFEAVKFGGHLVSRLTLIGGVGGSLNMVALVEPRSPQYAREVQDRALTTILRETDVRVVSPEDFIVMKILATRERDLEDARTVMRALASRLDLMLVEQTINKLSTEILAHDLRDRWRAVTESADLDSRI